MGEPLKEEEKINPGLEQILSGIKSFTAAANMRIEKPNEWDDSHRRQLTEMVKELADLKFAILNFLQ